MNAAALHVVIPSSALGAEELNLDLVPAEVHGWKEGRNFRLDSSAAAHREASDRFCRGVSTESLLEMEARGVDLATLQRQYAKLVAKHSRLVNLVRSQAS